ncbi:MAG: hypothetical protein HN576_13150 [Bacteriovoracaceae bacterium]|mgnify:CR=1 FL=1|jgi:hypothetical protein|nr:hypothetical protein [Bacteriovoracaceae bacterium]
MEKSELLKEINYFFRHRKGKIGGFEVFKNSGLFEFYGNQFGPLVYTDRIDLDFIGVDSEGYLFDEIYYPYEGCQKVGTIIPKMFLESNLSKEKPDPIWKEVAEKGYAIVEGISLSPDLHKEVLETGFIPHGLNDELNLSRSIYHAYFATLMDYDRPELHKNPEYMDRVTEECLKFVPRPSPIIKDHLFYTADMVKYLYDPLDNESIKGPYSFHMDYFSRLLYMFFVYFAKNTPVDGRELLVGQRKDFENFDAEALDRSPSVQPDLVSPFESLPDKDIINFDKINIQDGTVILMNTLNPMFVHKVEKLRSDNEVILITNYQWCKDWPKTD